MRKIVIAALTALAALAAVALTAQPAAALPGDDPRADQWYFFPSWDKSLVGCTVTNRLGEQGKNGAWGYYIAGCTAGSGIPAEAKCGLTRCRVHAFASITESPAAQRRVTVNARVRIYTPTHASAEGKQLRRTDKSCAGVDRCDTEHTEVIEPGQRATIQCNGVRQGYPLDRLGTPKHRATCHVAVRPA